jgi:hypothetical protein
MVGTYHQSDIREIDPDNEHIQLSDCPIAGTHQWFSTSVVGSPTARFVCLFCDESYEATIRPDNIFCT